MKEVNFSFILFQLGRRVRYLLACLLVGVAVSDLRAMCDAAVRVVALIFW